MEAWEPDLLGPGFESRELGLAPDAEGPVTATLVRRVRDESEGRGFFDVLYLHGWSDYFFQAPLAEYWTARGGRFHALDLRKYGRSLRPHQTPGYVEDLSTYDEEIDAALSVIGRSGPLLLVGHSTGGLVASLWAGRNPDRLAGLVLNSPWLELQTAAAGRVLLQPLTAVGSVVHPRREYPAVDLGFYTRTVSSRFEGEWEYRSEWRPEHGFATSRGWLNAVLRGQARLADGLSIPVPVLVLLSARSMLQPFWSERMRFADTAIDVGSVAHRAADLGFDVSIRRIEGALHDVVLSAEPIRERVWAAIDRWLPWVLAGATAGPRPVRTGAHAREAYQEGGPPA